MARLDRLNARLGARRARLLGTAGLRDLLARPSTEGRLELLRATAAGAALPAEAAGGAAALARAEAALRAAQRDEAARLLAEVEGGGARALLRAFLGLDEAEAVKAVIRGVARGAPLDATAAAAPAAPDLPEAAIRAAAAAPDVPAALASLAAAGSPVAAATLAALPPARGAAAPLPGRELAADRAAVERAREACRHGGEDGAILARHLADRVDARNARTLLALAGAAPAAPWWLAGGARFDEAALAALAGAGAAAARRAVAAAFGVSEGALESPWGADRALESAVLAPLRREARRRPLSLAVPLRYLLERREELRRTALVLRGAALALPGEEILDLVEA